MASLENKPPIHFSPSKARHGRITTLSRSDGPPRETHKKVRKITCLGSGFVGGPTSAVTAYKSDVEVTVVDIDSARICAWNSDILPIYEPGLYDIVRVARDGIRVDSPKEPNVPQAHPACARKPNLFFTKEIEKAIAEADLIFVCVNTPTKSNGVGKGAAADLGFVEAATRSIAEVATGDKIVVEKSTVPCRTAQSIREILSANAQPGVHFEVLSNPEFLAEGTAVRDLLHPDRVIIGSMLTASGRQAAASLVDVYSQWIPSERILTMNLWSSELSKLAANALLAQRISSVNALSAICEATGADVDEVSHACGLDSRIGPHMLKAGPGFGGSCFQKDIFNIVYLSESLGLHEVADYWRGIINMNELQKHRFTKRIISCLFNNLLGKKIAVFGFAFKKDTSDTRESPAITLVSNFVAEKAHVAIYDPKVQEEQIWKELATNGGSIGDMRHYVSICGSPYETADSADAVVIVTEWDEFSNKTVMMTGSGGDSMLKNSNNFQIPPKRSASLVIKDPNTGSVVTFDKPPPTQQPKAKDAKSSNHPLAKLPEPTSPILSNISINIPTSPTHASTKAPSIPPTPFSSPTRTAKGPISPRHRAIPSVEERLSAFNFGPEVAAKVESEKVDWARIARGMRRPMFVFDGRGVLDGEALEALGFRYEAIGKASRGAMLMRDGSE